MLASLRRVLALVHKELLAVLKDARTRNMLLLQPVLQCLLFGYAATLDLNNVPYAVIDRDRSSAIRRASSAGSAARGRPRISPGPSSPNRRRCWRAIPGSTS